MIVCGGRVTVGWGCLIWLGDSDEESTSSNWNDSWVRMGESDVSDIYMLSCDDPAKFRREYFVCCGGAVVVTVLIDAC